MSDFLIHLVRKSSARGLLKTLRRPYGADLPEGESFAFPWGAMAVLRERLVGGRNILARGDSVCAWVGDLILGEREACPSEMAGHMERLRHRNGTNAAATDGFFGRLNGTFAIVSADNEGVSIITDPLNAVPVYFALDDGGEVVAVGTHADTVASVGVRVFSLDPASAGEFINRGTPVFPHTIHSHVKEFEPGSFHRLTIATSQTVDVSSDRYWSPPPEDQNGCDRGRLARELTAALLAAVNRRCHGHKVVVKLSGGLDSRVILAAVPRSVECATVTFCDELNREAATAREVARVYQRPWRPLFREEEYLANNFVRAVRFSGCEHEWVHAHGAGLAGEIVRDDATCVLDGQWSNAFLRLYFAADVARVNRLGGLLPPRYENVAFDYANQIDCFCTENVESGVLERMRFRRREFHDRNRDPSRTSVAEWLDNYPVTQEAPLSTWLVERRLMPVRMVYLDREVIELGYRCPLRFKLGDGLFGPATRPILGRGCRIPNANDGVRPGSGHISRLAQRAVRKVKNRADGVVEAFGCKPKVHHSWHDYQTYWQESEKLAQLVEEYAPNLDPLDGVVFHTSARDLLRSREIPWTCGFRLLQLAVWLGIFRQYGSAGAGHVSLARDARLQTPVRSG